jgi:dimethylglycine catabolism A
MVSASTLLEPFSHGRLRLANRVAFVATVNNLGLNRDITPEQVAFYEARAAGGVGLIVTEGLSVHPTSIPNSTVPLAYEPALIDGFSRLAEAVHRHGSQIYGQLWHVGRQALWSHQLQPWSPSGERDPYSGSTPHAMSEEEIFEVVDGFAAAAQNLQRAGFDGVELHGAHGYLITQFLSPSSNRRDDRWGGSTENRSRFVRTLVERIREDCGSEFGVGLKLSAHEYVSGGIDLSEAQRLVEAICTATPPDYIAVSQSNFSPSLEYHVPDIRFPDVPFRELAEGIRQVAAPDVPVMALAKVPDIETGASLVDENIADLIGMSRALLADPRLVDKARSGEVPRPCVYCNVCWEFIHTNRPIACIYAPETGAELAFQEPEALAEDDRRRIHVIGAGPAGLEFARTAALRGHAVEVHEARPQVGGRLLLDASVPGREPMRAAVDWLQQAAEAAGATITVDDPIGADRAASWDGDVLVIATGSEAELEPLRGAETVLSLESAMSSIHELVGPVVIVDEIEEEPVYAAAEAIAEAGHPVVLLTRRAAIGRRVAYVSLIGVLRRLDEHGVDIHTLMIPDRVEFGRLIARHAFSGIERDLGPVGTIVRAGPYRPSAIEVSGNPATIIIGDASAPRSVAAVVREANRAAQSVGRTT